MSRNHRTRTLWCKKADVTPLLGTLQEMLAAALGGDVIDRLEDTSPDPDASSFQVIAQHYPVGQGIAGIFTSYVPGASAVSVEIARGTKQLDLAQLRPPKSADAGKVREWAEGLLYFYCKGDFVVVIQSSAVKMGQFEEHLSWLLKAPGELIGPTVVLKDRPIKAAVAKVRKSHVKRIRIGGTLLQPSEETTRVSTQSTHVRLGGSLLDAVKAALLKGGGFHWEDALGGNLKATLQLTYDRTTTTKGQKLLDEIGLAFRNIDDVDTQLVLGDGQKLSANELRLTTKAKILADQGVLVADSAFAVMHSWFIDLANAGELS